MPKKVASKKAAPKKAAPKKTASNKATSKKPAVARPEPPIIPDEYRYMTSNDQYLLALAFNCLNDTIKVNYSELAKRMGIKRGNASKKWWNLKAKIMGKVTLPFKEVADAKEASKKSRRTTKKRVAEEPPTAAKPKPKRRRPNTKEAATAKTKTDKSKEGKDNRALVMVKVDLGSPRDPAFLEQFVEHDDGEADDEEETDVETDGEDTDEEAFHGQVAAKQLIAEEAANVVPLPDPIPDQVPVEDPAMFVEDSAGEELDDDDASAIIIIRSEPSSAYDTDRTHSTSDESDNESKTVMSQSNGGD